MPDIVAFSRNIRSIASKIDNGDVVVVKRTARKVLRELIYGSPADKGDLRSNYRVSIGGTKRAFIDAYAPGKKLGMSETGNASAAYAIGAAEISSLNPTGALTKSIKISNAAPYIDRLNGGYVKQTAPGFVERAVEKGRGVVKQFRFFDIGPREEE